MSFFRFFLRSSRRSYGILLTAVVVGAASGLASVALLALIHRTLESEGELALGWAGLAFAGLCVLATATRVGSQYILARLGQGMARELRLDLSRRILGAPLRRLEELGPDRLMATLTEDVTAIVQALVFVPVLCVNGTIVVGCLAYLAWMSPPLFLLLLAVIAVGVVSYQVPAQAGIRRFRRAREEQDTLFQHFRGLLHGAKELRLHGARRTAFYGLVEETTERVRRLRLNASLVFGAAGAWGHLLFFAVIGVLLFGRGGLVPADTDTLMGYTIVLLYMMTPLQTLLDGVPNLGRSEVAVAKIDRLGLSLRPEAEAAAPAPGGALSPPPAPAPWRRIELRGVTHTYRREGEEHDFTLGPLDWTLEPGEIVFLIGGNGSGKTTLAKVLAGLYEPQGGEVLLDGRPVGAAGRDRYRQLFSAVFSDFFLFETLLGLEAPNLDERTRGHLEALRIDHKVKVEDGRLSTLDLSQGQRKRLALLTAYLEDREVYLFDEWAADQDPVFKEVFYRQILGDLKARGKAVVVISHDDRYFHLADQVLRLEDGRLRFEGGPAELRDLAPAAPRPVSEVRP